MANKKSVTIEPLYDYSITVPVPSAYKRNQVYEAMRWFSSCEISGPVADALKIKFFGLTESACDLRRAILASRVKHRRGSRASGWTDERTPVNFRVGDCTFAVVSRNGKLSVELDESTGEAHGEEQDAPAGAYSNSKPAEKVCGRKK